MKEKKVVLVTGASSGIGRLTAERLYQKGYRVFGTSRHPDGRKDLPFPLLKLDVTDAAMREEAVQEVLHREGRLDVLVNNAGMGIAGPVEECGPEKSRYQMETVFWGAVEMSRLVLPAMRAQQGGRIICVSSIAGRIGLPYQAYYSAAKFAMEGLFEGLQLEVARFGIDIVLVEPGDMRTRFTADRDWCLPDNSPYLEQTEKTKAIIEKNELSGGNPERVARKIVRIIEKKYPRFRYMVGKPEEVAAVWLRSLLPSRLFGRVLASFYGIKLHP